MNMGENEEKEKELKCIPSTIEKDRSGSLLDEVGASSDIEFDGSVDLLGNAEVKSASMDKLLDKLMTFSLTFIQQFYDTFPAFYSCEKLFDFLVEQYEKNEYLPENTSRKSTLQLTSMENMSQDSIITNFSHGTLGNNRFVVKSFDEHEEDKLGDLPSKVDDEDELKTLRKDSTVSAIVTIRKEPFASGSSINKRNNHKYSITHSRSNTEISTRRFTDTSHLKQSMDQLPVDSAEEIKAVNTTRIISLKLLRKWLVLYSQDFNMGPLASKLNEFLNNCEKKVDKKDQSWRYLNVCVITVKENVSKEEMSRSFLNVIDENAFKIRYSFHLEDFWKEEFADILTILDLEMHRCLNYRELLDVNWTKPNKKDVSPTVSRAIEHFNLVSRMIQVRILHINKISARAKFISFIIGTLANLETKRNFNGTIAVMSALDSTPIIRLKKTWSKVKDKSQKYFNELKRKYTPDGNYRNLRSIIAKCNYPLIPFLGCYLTTLMHINDGAQTLYANGKVNFIKCRKISYVFGQIKKCMAYSKTNKVSNEKISYVMSLIKVASETEEEIFQLSLNAEPR